jgi:pimeloyl-ACP methyl ester carboxylesterase
MKISSVWLALVIAGSAIASNRTGFVVERQDVGPAANSYSGPRGPIRISEPGDKILIVYSHGTTRPQQIEDCDASWNQVPRSLLAIQSEKVLIYYLCSTARESNSTWGSAGQYIYGRVKEVEATLDEFIALGVSPKNIFLAGHSAGGWTSLMAQRHLGRKFNAAIVFAPAFAGRRADESRYPHWYQEARPRQIREMLEAPEIRALIFAYYGDPFERPEDLKFLTEQYPRTVHLIGYECDIQNRHLVHVNDCRETATTAAISKYIREMAIR